MFVLSCHIIFPTTFIESQGFENIIIFLKYKFVISLIRKILVLLHRVVVDLVWLRILVSLLSTLGTLLLSPWEHGSRYVILIQYDMDLSIQIFEKKKSRVRLRLGMRRIFYKYV